MKSEDLISLSKEHRVDYAIIGAQAAGRPKDQEDLRYLEEIKRQQSKKQ